MHPLRSRSPSQLVRDAILGLGLLVTVSGCTLCPAPYDYDYGGFVSRTPRSDMRHGRVGSIFSDPALAGGSETVELSGAPVDGSPEVIDGIEIHDPVGSGLLPGRDD